MGILSVFLGLLQVAQGERVHTFLRITNPQEAVILRQQESLRGAALLPDPFVVRLDGTEGRDQGIASAKAT